MRNIFMILSVFKNGD